MPIHFSIEIGDAKHVAYAERICRAIEEAAAQRGTGIALRTPEYISSKLRDGKAVIALAGDPGEQEPELAGFCYIETWGGKKYVANSGLIVLPAYRHSGLAGRIKTAAYELSRSRFPEAKLFGITTSHAVMKINTDLGYVPVPFSELTDDEEFWQGCRSCPNVDILERTRRQMCLCTGMLCDPNDARTQLRRALNSERIQIELPEHAGMVAPLRDAGLQDLTAGDASLLAAETVENVTKEVKHG